MLEPKDMARTEIPFIPDEDRRAHATPPTVPDVSPLCTAPSVTAETITDDELCALRDDAIASGDATPPTVPDVSPLCTAPSVTAETITDDELCALRDDAIASGDDGTRNIACGALNAVDEFQAFACRHACAVVLNAKRSGRP